MNITELKYQIDAMDRKNTLQSNETKLKYCEQCTLELYYQIINATIDSTLANAKKYGAQYVTENYFFATNHPNKERMSCLDCPDCTIEQSEYESEIYCATFPNLYRVMPYNTFAVTDKVFTLDFFINLLEQHPYSVLFSKIKKDTESICDTSFYFTSSLENIKIFKAAILAEKAQAKVCDKTIIESCRKMQSENPSKKFLKSLYNTFSTNKDKIRKKRNNDGYWAV